jgi:hypothetical protein
MPRLGELLVAAGLLTTEQVDQALRAQVIWGGRLGTNLVELHLIDLDALSKALGRLHRLPAALAAHFDRADPALQRALPAELAERLSCIPVMRTGPTPHVVIAALGPLAPHQLAGLAEALAIDRARLVVAVAAELRIRYQLERVYGIVRAARFLRTRGTAIPVFAVPPPELDPTASGSEDAEQVADAEPAGAPRPAPEDLDQLEVASRHPALDDELGIPHGPSDDPAGGRERRTYVRTIADAAWHEADPDRQALLARVAIRKIAVGSAPRTMAGATLAEATQAIRRSTARDRVAELVIDTLDRFTPSCESAIILVVRSGTAIGWKGFHRRGAALGEIAVPLDDGGLVARAIELNVTARRSLAELDPIDRLLLAALGRDVGDLVVVPIAIGDRVMCAIAIATAEGAALASAAPIASAAGAAIARLMRDASR